MKIVIFLLAIICLSPFGKAQSNSSTEPILKAEPEDSIAYPILTEEMVRSLPVAKDYVRGQVLRKKQSAVSVEVYANDGKGFNQRLAKALEISFKSSPDFNLSHGKKPNSLIATITSYTTFATDWKQKGAECYYTVEFSSVSNETLGISVGSCLSEAPAKCTYQILKDAKNAAQFLGNTSLVLQKPIQVTIPEIRSDPLKYNGKLVQILGLAHTGHWGISVKTEDRQTAITLRSPDEVGCPIPLQKDATFREFWNISTDNGFGSEKVIHVVLDGLVRVLKVNGKMAEEFYPHVQWPLEIIPIRILKIEIEPEPEPAWKTEHPQLLPFDPSIHSTIQRNE